MKSVSANLVVFGSSCLSALALLGGNAAAQTPESSPAPEAPAAPAAPVASPAAEATPGEPAASEPSAPAPSAESQPQSPEGQPQSAEGAPAADGLAAPVAPELPAPAAPGAPADPAAAEPAPAAPALALSTPPTSVEDTHEAASGGNKPRQFGAMLDLGVPDGTTVSFVYRPIAIARVHAGLGYNGVSPGLRLGGEYIPFGWGPSIGMALGHYFEGDANGLAGMFGDPGEGSKLLENVGYSYFALRAGMEFGGDRFTFFGRGGVTWLKTTIHELDSLIQPEEGSNMTVSVREDPVLSAFVPTLQLGMIVQL